MSQKNNAAVGVEGAISTRDARIQVYVIPSDEEAVIARETAATVSMKLGRSANRPNLEKFSPTGASIITICTGAVTQKRGRPVRPSTWWARR